MNNINYYCNRYRFKPYLGILPGWAWLSEHEHDLDDYKPTFEIYNGQSRHTMTINKPEIIRQIVNSL